MKRSLSTVLTFARISTKRFFRDKVALFFGILFPLIFLFVFGNLYTSNTGMTFRVAVINQSESEFATQFIDGLADSEIININEDIDTMDAAQEKMIKSELDAAINLPETFGQIQPGQEYPSGQIKIVYTQNNQQSAVALNSVMEAQFKAINAQFIKVDEPFTVTSEQLNENSLSAFDFSFAGLLGFSIIGIGIFGPVNVFPELKKMGILRRLSTTPLRTWQYFLSTMIGQAVTGILSFACMFIVAITMFDLQVTGSWIEIIAFLLLSMVTILGIGLAIGGWAKNERQAAPLSNIVVFPMMFLSGTFFPRFLMPEWLQNLSSILPLTPVIDGVRLLTTESKTLIDILPQVGMVSIWLVIIYFIALRVFRWE